MNEQPLVLIVDDEPDFREIFAAKLSSAGFRVDTAEDGKIALEKMGKQIPDIVLMDVRMPVMDGPTAVLKMRDDEKLKTVKVAFLTSLGDPRLEMQDINRRFSEDFGAQGYLKKTDDLDILVENIKRFLS